MSEGINISDESSFSLQQPDNRRLSIGREPGTHNNPQFICDGPQYKCGGKCFGGHEILRPVVFLYGVAVILFPIHRTSSTTGLKKWVCKEWTG